jgi:predicted Zn-ribbon and HTH transcriptional regulator
MDRIANRINMDKVIEVLNQQTPTSINRMVRRFRTENNDKILNKQTNKDRIRSNTITSATENQTPPAEDMETN